MNIAMTARSRSNCSRRSVAAVVVKDRRIMSTGYNGTPSGVRNCFEGGCERCASDVPSGQGLDQCVCAHAEENAIVQAARYGVSLLGSSIYVTDSPCLFCARLIIGAGIREVVYHSDYKFGPRVAALFKEAGVRYRRFALECAPCPPARGRKLPRSKAAKGK